MGDRHGGEQVPWPPIQKAFMSATPGCVEHHSKPGAILAETRKQHVSHSVGWTWLMPIGVSTILSYSSPSNTTMPLSSSAKPCKPYIQTSLQRWLQTSWILLLLHSILGCVVIWTCTMYGTRNNAIPYLVGTLNLVWLLTVNTADISDCVPICTADCVPICTADCVPIEVCIVPIYHYELLDNKSGLYLRTKTLQGVSGGLSVFGGI